MRVWFPSASYCGAKSSIAVYWLRLLAVVGLAFGGGAISDVFVGVGNLVGRNKFIADVATVLLVIDKNTTAVKEGRSPL